MGSGTFNIEQEREEGARLRLRCGLSSPSVRMFAAPGALWEL